MKALKTAAIAAIAAYILATPFAIAGPQIPPPKYHGGGGAGKLYGGVTDDGGGIRIKKGHVIKVPPRVDMPSGQTQTQVQTPAPAKSEVAH